MGTSSSHTQRVPHETRHDVQVASVIKLKSKMNSGGRKGWVKWRYNGGILVHIWSSGWLVGPHVTIHLSSPHLTSKPAPPLLPP